MRYTAQIATLAMLLALASPAMGQIPTTGQISGLAQDDEGNPLPGVTIVATSKALQGERAALSDANGVFNLAYLPTGSYMLEFRMDGFTTMRLEEVQVLLGRITPVSVGMRAGEMSEKVLVTADYPLIQPKTADLSTNLSLEQIDQLPSAARTFVDLTKYSPSITSTEFNSTDPTSRAAPAPSIRGEGQYGDNYLVDGLSVRDPSVKTAGTPLNYDAMQEVQIVTDGFSPEFGQSLGGSVNVVTRSGSNEFGGEVAYIFRDDSSTAEFKDTLLGTPSGFERTTPYVNVGGPIMQDRLWYFGSYNYADIVDEFAASELTGFGTLPAGEIATERDLVFGKLTFAATGDHRLSANYTWRDQTTTGFDANIATPEARRGQDVTDRRLRFNYQATFSANSLLDVKYGTVNREIDTVPLSGLGPAQYEITDFGLLTNNSWRASTDERTRDDAAIVYTQFISTGVGTHEIKAGLDWRELNQDSGDFFSGTAEDFFVIGANPAQPDFGMADTFVDGVKYLAALDPTGTFPVPTVANNYKSGGVLNNRNDEFGGFLQDRWEYGNWNVLAGFRFDKQKGLNDVGETYFKYDPSDALAPRISITWDAGGTGRNIVKTGWGRFYDASSLRLGEFANSRDTFSFRSYSWVGMTDDDFRDHIDMGDAYDIHNVANWSFTTEQSQAQNPIDYTPLTQPAQVDRFLIEYDRQVGNDFVAKIRFVDGETRKLIDDIHTNFFEFTMANTDLKRRDYKALELEFNGNPTPNISFNASYVHSAAKGTTPGQFELAGFLGDSGSGNNIGVYLDRPPSEPQFWCDNAATLPGWDPVSCTRIAPFFGGWPGNTSPMADYNNDDVVDENDFDIFWQNLWGGLGGLDGDDGWYGHLPYSADDVVKINGRFTVPQWADAYVSAFLTWNSGYRDQRKGFQGLYGDFLSFDEVPVYTFTGADCTTPGSFATCEASMTFTPVSGQSFGTEQGQARGVLQTGSFWQLDVAVGKVWNVGKDVGLEVRGELFNAFNTQEGLAQQNRATESFGTTLVRQFPRSLRLFGRLTF